MSVIGFEQHQCKKIRSYLDSYLNNELLVETNHEVLKHLENCESCSQALADRSSVKTLLQNAVLREQAPAELRYRIQRDIRKSAAPFRWTQWALAAAAAAVLLVGALGVVRLVNSRGQHPRVEQALSAQTVNVLKIGLGDHVYCAIDHHLANQRFTAAEMAEKMGPDYAGVVDLVKKKVPSAYQIVVGHRCHVEGREFVHVILRNETAIVSVIVTRKSGESFPRDALAPVLEESGIPVYGSRLGEFEVAGFETREHLVFVASALGERDNLQIASNLAPVMRDFLARLEA